MWLHMSRPHVSGPPSWYLVASLITLYISVFFATCVWLWPLANKTFGTPGRPVASLLDDARAFSSPSARFPLLSPVDIPALAYVKLLQSSACMPVTSSTRVLIFSCSANSLYLEGSDEQYQGHFLGGVSAIVRALVTAVATARLLFLDRSECAIVKQLNDTQLRDAGLACCDWDTYFQPVWSCEVPIHFARNMWTTASPFTSDPVVAYDAKQQCLWQDEIWDGLTRKFPDTSQLVLMKTLAYFLLQPSASLSTHLHKIKRSLFLSTEHPVALQVPSFLPRIDGESLAFSRDVPLRTYISLIRNHIATRTSSSSSLLLWASVQEARILKESLEHIEVMDLLSTVRASIEDKDAELIVLITAILFMAEHAVEWIGMYGSVVTELVYLRSSENFRVWDMHGDLWTAACWSSSNHLLSAHQTEPTPYNNPSVTTLLTSSRLHFSLKNVPFPQLVLIMGAAYSGVDELYTFLSHWPTFSPSEELSRAWSDLFVPRVSVDHYNNKRAFLLTALRSIAHKAQLNGAHRVLIHFHLSAIEPADRSLGQYQHTSFLAHLINQYALPLSLKVLTVVQEAHLSLTAGLFTNVTGEAGDTFAADDVLPVGKILRDVLVEVDAECKGMDVSLYRMFRFETLFSCAGEQHRMARFLGMDHEEGTRFAAAFRDRAAMIKPVDKLAAERTLQQDTLDVMSDLFAAIPALQLFNPSHPAYDSHANVYEDLLLSAKRFSFTASAGTFADHLIDRQNIKSCDSSRLLVFDGFLCWTRTTPPSTQLLDLLRTMTLALASNRVLVTSKVQGSVLEWLKLDKPCADEALAALEGRQQAAQNATMDKVGRHALREARVIVDHSTVIDLSYLAIWNDQHPFGVLGIHEYIRSLLEFLLSPVNDSHAEVMDAKDRHLVRCSPSRSSSPDVVVFALHPPFDHHSWLPKSLDLMDCGVFPARCICILSVAHRILEHVWR